MSEADVKRILTPNQSANFFAAANMLYDLVKSAYSNFQPIASKGEDGKVLVSLRAQCKRCPHNVMASVDIDSENSAQTLAEYFLSRAEFHARSHKVVLPRGSKHLKKSRRGS